MNSECPVRLLEDVMKDRPCDHELRVIEHYERHTEEFYIKRWDQENMHFGVFAKGENVSFDAYMAGDHSDFRRGIRRLTKVITKPANITSLDFVVDAGCGVGGVAMDLAREYGCRVRGLNISSKQIDIARKNAEAAGLTDLIDFAWSDCSQGISLPSQSVDVIVNIESTCHYSNREIFISECARILKPGGRLVSEDLIADAGIDQRATIEAACAPWAMHFPLETRDSYRWILERYGFSVVSLRTIEGFMPGVALMRDSARAFRMAQDLGHKLSQDEFAWLALLETMSAAIKAGHLTILGYHAVLE